jgi:predicted protein tyrosine phosphatase
MNNISRNDVCGQNGNVSIYQDEYYWITFAKGECENDRALLPRRFECMVSDKRLICLDDSNNYKMIFKPKNV